MKESINIRNKEFRKTKVIQSMNALYKKRAIKKLVD